MLYHEIRELLENLHLLIQTAETLRYRQWRSAADPRPEAFLIRVSSIGHLLIGVSNIGHLFITVFVGSVLRAIISVQEASRTVTRNLRTIHVKTTILSWVPTRVQEQFLAQRGGLEDEFAPAATDPGGEDKLAVQHTAEDAFEELEGVTDSVESGLCWYSAASTSSTLKSSHDRPL